MVDSQEYLNRIEKIVEKAKQMALETKSQARGVLSFKTHGIAR